MATSTLNQRRLESLRPRPGEQYVVWDGVIPGFGVRVSPQGARAFVLKYRLPSGRVRWKTIGRVGAVALDQARRLAKIDLGLVADGEDPLEAKDSARGAVTLKDVADRFLEEHVEARRKGPTQRLYRQVLTQHVIPRLGARSLAEVSTDDVLKLHHRLKATPVMANRTLAVLSALFGWAAKSGYRGKGPHVNPCLGIEKFRERPRERYLTDAELKRLGAALRVGQKYQRLSPSAAAVIQLLLFTGARVGELLSLRRDAVELEKGLLRLADSKTGAKVIVLNGPALEVLRSWPKIGGSPFVFPSETRRKPVVGEKKKERHRFDLNRPWRWLRHRARLNDVRIHDLRHSFASVAVSNSHSLPTVGALLGHRQAATTQRYAHLMDDPLRQASEGTAKTIATALRGRS